MDIKSEYNASDNNEKKNKIMKFYSKGKNFFAKKIQQDKLKPNNKSISKKTSNNESEQTSYNKIIIIKR